jgi:hypothetical protein
MVVNQPYEVYTLAIGFFLNNRIWDLMVMTGIAYIPVITMIVNSIVDAYSGGDDEGDRGSVALRHIEMGIMRIFFVMIFVLIPNGTPFSTQSVAYQQNTCAKDSFLGGISVGEETTFFTAVGNIFSDTTKDVALDGTLATGNVNISNGYQMNISGTQPRPPYLLEFVHNASSQSVNAIVKTMPCETDFAGASISMGELAFKKEDAQDFLGIFVQQCYLEALREESNDSGIQSGEINDDYWIGSSTLYNGDYKTRLMDFDTDYWAKLQQGFISSIPLYAYSSANDEGTKDDGRSSPSCQAGYDAVKTFVNRDYAKQISDMNDPSKDNDWNILEKLMPSWFGDGNSSNRGVDSIIKRLTSLDSADQLQANTFRTQNDLNGKNLSGDIIELVGEGLTATTLAEGYLNTLIEGTVQRSLAMPLAAIIQAFIITVAPILILLSGYSIKSVVMIAITMFGFEMLHLVFELCAWMDNSLIALTASSYTNMSAENQATKMAVYNAVNLAYVLLPVIWFQLLSTASGALAQVGSAMAGSAAGISGMAKENLKGAKEYAGGKVKAKGAAVGGKIKSMVTGR